jgi:GNAT superfamily N-acetyltransferase
MTGVELLVEDTPDPDHIRQLHAGLGSYTARQLEPEPARPLAVFCRQGQQIVGGALGETQWKWLYIRQLWVDDALRHQGIGRQLVAAIEDQARRRGCHAAWLHSFSAIGFHQAVGYHQFGELTDFPPGHTRHYLWKPLGTTPA